MKKLESLLLVPLLLTIPAVLGAPTARAASPASAPEAEIDPPASSDEAGTPDPSRTSPSEISEPEPEVTIVSRTKVIRVPRTAPRRSPAGVSAVRAILNPNTGSLVSMPRASRENLVPISERLRRGLSTSDEGLQEVRLPDGTVAVDLQGRFLSVLTARVGEDGEVGIGHAPIEHDLEDGRAPDGEAGQEKREGGDR